MIRICMRHLWLLAVAIVLVGYQPATAQFDSARDTTNAATSVSGDVVTANTEFGFSLLNWLANQEPEKNVFISPASVSIALAMTMNGANGDTLNLMSLTLHLLNVDIDHTNSAYRTLLDALQQPGSGVEISIANSLWAKEGVPFKQDFIDCNEAYYDAELSSLKGAPATINKWAEDATKGRIKNLISGLDPKTYMVLANAVYFKGKWKDPFKPELTKDRTFHLQNGSDIAVPMMSRTGYYRYLENDTVQVINMPYGEGRFSMIICLPKEGLSLRDLRSGITLNGWNSIAIPPYSWSSMLPGRRQGDTCQIVLPRLKLEYKADSAIKKSLTQMGMGIAFDPKRADFSEMLDSQQVWIDTVVHKTFLEVNEEGTEAAAATAVTSYGSAPSSDEPTKVIVDHPFLLAIVDNETGMVLFLGAIMDPR